jgi:Glu-tRNA(Gln) amidotransferase subunit E-like FAD-binding protein
MEKSIELKVGLEIHQQLDTGKLFCRCPSIIRQDTPNVIINRKLHAVKGESGEIDKAAEFESGKEKEFIYQGYNDSTCLLEYDECPPYEINQEALQIALQVSLLMNCDIIQDTQIMRKTVVDGSNTSGFQRTLLLARNGFIETNSGRVGIQSVCLEEDAARIISQESEKVIYRLDRLGIPLLEIATKPEIKSPEQAKEAALKIGEILRACKVKRGIGTIRQDVNVSIKSGSKQGERIEIKGVQEPELISKTINSEIERQQELLKQNRSISEVRRANPDGTTSFLRPMPGADRMYPETDLPLLHISKEMLDNARKTLPKLKTELIEELASQGLNLELTRLVLDKNKLEDFKELSKIYKSPSLIAKIVALWPNELASKLNKPEEELNLHLDVLESILKALIEKKITESEIKPIMLELAEGKELKDILAKEKSQINLEEEIHKIIKEKPGLSENAYMGLVMAKFKGQVQGSEVMKIINKLIK